MTEYTYTTFFNPGSASLPLIQIENNLNKFSNNFINLKKI